MRFCKFAVIVKQKLILVSGTKQQEIKILIKNDFVGKAVRLKAKCERFKM